MFDKHLVVYHHLGDCMFYVTAAAVENECILHTVLVTFQEVVSSLLG